MSSIGSISSLVATSAIPKVAKEVADAYEAVNDPLGVVSSTQATFSLESLSRLADEVEAMASEAATAVGQTLEDIGDSIADAAGEVGELAQDGLDAVGSAVDTVASYATVGYGAVRQLLK